MLVDVEYCLDCEALLLVDEALAELFELDVLRRGLVEHPDVLSRRKLPLFAKSFVLLVLTNLDAVSV